MASHDSEYTSPWADCAAPVLLGTVKLILLKPLSKYLSELVEFGLNYELTVRIAVPVQAPILLVIVFGRIKNGKGTYLVTIGSLQAPERSKATGKTQPFDAAPHYGRKCRFDTVFPHHFPGG
jgi:hypothetical protein